MQISEIDCNCDNRRPVLNEVYEQFEICLNCRAIYQPDGDFLCYEDEVEKKGGL